MVIVKDIMDIFTIMLDGILGGIMERWYGGSVSVGGHFVYNNTMFNSVDKNDIMVLNVQAVMILILVPL